MIELNADQRREFVNTSQRFAAFEHARLRARGYRGSLVWQNVRGHEYLVRSYYDEIGIRRQKVEGRRDAPSEEAKRTWDEGRAEAERSYAELSETLARQAAINRALRLGRIPVIGAKIIRALDAAGYLGRGIRVAGTNSIYAYEAAAGVMSDASVIATVDIDLLRDSRQSLRVAANTMPMPQGILGLLRKVDGSFQRQVQTYSAVNKAGYAVDLIEAERVPPWREAQHPPVRDDDLQPVAIEGLIWLDSSPAFEAVAIDEKGAPVRIVTSDPRIFVVHKLWLSRLPSREPMKRARDRMQAEIVARIVREYLTHLRYDDIELQMVPHELFEAARPLFET